MATQRVKRESQALGPAGPSIDEPNMRYFGAEAHAPADVIDFTHYRAKNSKAKGNGEEVKLDPPHVIVDELKPLRREPLCDIFSTSTRLKINPPTLLKPHWKDIAVSTGIHVLVLAGVMILPLLTSSKREHVLDEEPIEVSFGISDALTNSFKEMPKPEVPAPQEPEVLPEAKKAEEQLPQLAKNMALDAPTNEENLMPAPAKPTPAPTPTEEPKPTPVATVKETPPPNTKKITQEELLRRMERENRKVAEKEQEGTKNKKNAKENIKDPNELPKNPFASDLPKSPPGLGPSGDIKGTLVDASVKQQYTGVVMRHLKQAWTLPETKDFGADLVVVLVFKINSFGKIIGAVEVEKSSGNKDFDEEAMTAVQSASPFPDLPEELEPSVTLHPSLRPRDAQK
jgi:TonB family protein